MRNPSRQQRDHDHMQYFVVTAIKLSDAEEDECQRDVLEKVGVSAGPETEKADAKIGSLGLLACGFKKERVCTHGFNIVADEVLCLHTLTDNARGEKELVQRKWGSPGS
jgi:hypothetical protein